MNLHLDGGGSSPLPSAQKIAPKPSTTDQIRTAVAPASAATQRAIERFAQSGAGRTQLQSALWSEMVEWSLAEKGDAQAAASRAAMQLQGRALLTNHSELEAAETAVVQNHAAQLDPAKLMSQVQAAAIVASGKFAESDDAALQSMTEGLNGASLQTVDNVLANSWSAALAQQVEAQMTPQGDSGSRTDVSGAAFLANLLGAHGSHAQVNPELAAFVVKAAMPTLRSFASNPDSTGFTVTQEAFADVYQDLESAGATAAAPSGAALDTQLVDAMVDRYQDTIAMPVSDAIADELSGTGHLPATPFLDESSTSTDFFVAVVQQGESLSDPAQTPRQADDFGGLADALKLFHVQIPTNAPGALPYGTHSVVLDDATTGAASTTLTSTEQSAVVQRYMSVLQTNHDAAVKAGIPAGTDPWSMAVTMTREDIGMPTDGQNRATLQYSVADEPMLAGALVILKNQTITAANPDEDPNQATAQAIAQVRGLNVFSAASVATGTKGLLASLPADAGNNPGLVTAVVKTDNAYNTMTSAESSGDASGMASATAAYHKALITELQAVYPQLADVPLTIDVGYANWLRYAEEQVVLDHEQEDGITGQLVAAEVVHVSCSQADQATQVATFEEELSELQTEPDSDPHDTIQADVEADGSAQALLNAAFDDVISQADVNPNRTLRDAVQSTAQALAPYAQDDPSGALTQRVLGSSAMQKIMRLAQASVNGGGLTSAASLMSAAQDSPGLALALYREVEPAVLADLRKPGSASQFQAAAEIYQVVTIAQTASDETQDYRMPFLAAFSSAVRADYGSLKVEERTVNPASKVAVTETVTVTTPQQTDVRKWIDTAAAYGPQLFNDVLKGMPAAKGQRGVSALTPGASLVAIIDEAEDQPTSNSASGGFSGEDPTSTALINAQMQDGLQPQSFTSLVALTNYVGSAYGLQANIPGADDQAAVAAGTWLYYDPQTMVFGTTTLRSEIQALVKASGYASVSTQTPVSLRAMPLMIDGALGARFTVQGADGAEQIAGPESESYGDIDDWEQNGIGLQGSDVTEEFGAAPVIDADNNLAPLLVSHVAATPKMSTASFVIGGLGLLGMALSTFDGEVTAPIFAGMEGAAVAADADEMAEETLAVATVTGDSGEAAGSVVKTIETVTSESAANPASAGSWAAQIQVGRWTLGTLGRSIVAAQGAYGTVQDAPALWRDPGNLGNWIQFAGDIASLGEGLSVVARIARTGNLGAKVTEWARGVSREVLAETATQSRWAVNGLVPTLVRRASALQRAAFLASSAYGFYKQFSQWSEAPAGLRWLNAAQDLETLGLFALSAGRAGNAEGEGVAAANERERRNEELRQVLAGLARERATEQAAASPPRLWTPGSADEADVPPEITTPAGMIRLGSGLLVNKPYAGPKTASGLWLVRTSFWLPRTRALLGTRFLAVYAHPDDETLMRDTYRQLIEQGAKLDVCYFTLSNGGTMFELSEKGVPVPVRNAGTGQDETDPAAYGAERVREMVDYWKSLGGDESNLTITVLDNPDFNPYRAPRDNVDYGLKAGWNSEFNQRVLLEMLRVHRYEAVFSTDGYPRIHEAHVKANMEVRAALDRFSEESSAPPLVTVIEEGYYSLSDLRALQNSLDWPLSEEELEENNAVLRYVYPRQPPGHFRYVGNERPRVLLRIQPDITQENEAYLRHILRPMFTSFDEETPRRMQKSLILRPDRLTAGAPLLGLPGDLGPAALVESAQLFSARTLSPTPKGRPATPAMLKVPKREPIRRVETVPSADDQTRPLVVAESAAELRGKVGRAQLFAGEGIGRKPYQITPEEEPNWFWLQTGAPFVKEPTLRERFALVNSDSGDFWHGPQKIVTVFVTSLRQADEVSQADNLALDDATRVWMDLSDARGEANLLFKQEFLGNAGQAGMPRLPHIYRVSAPPELLVGAVREGQIPTEWLDGAMFTVDDSGQLFHETWVNEKARYAQEPGEAYSEPTRTGMPGKQVRRAALTAATIMSASAASAYTVRWGLGGGGDILSTDWSALINAGLGAFGYRSTINAAVRIARDRLANRLDALNVHASGSPLDLVERQLHGWRATLRGIPRDDQNAYSLATQMLRSNPEEPDPAALRMLDAASEKVMSRESLVARILELARIGSYGVNDAANLRIWAFWLRPDAGMFNFSAKTLADLANSSSAIATDGFFLGVHWGVNGSEIMQRSLEAYAHQHNLSENAQVKGARARGVYRGNDHLGPAMRRLIGLGDGASITHPGVLPDDNYMNKPPFILRLREHAMAAAAVIGAGPFAAADGFSALHSFAAGLPGSGLINLGMLGADMVFARGYRDSYVDLYRANRGMGPNVRKSFVPWLNEPLKGAERYPRDITKRRLLDIRDGLLSGFAPPVLVGVGMGTRVVLGLLFPSNQGGTGRVVGGGTSWSTGAVWPQQGVSSTQLSAPPVAEDLSILVDPVTLEQDRILRYEPLHYAVRSGDTLAAIARKHERTLLTAQEQEDPNLDMSVRDRLAQEHLLEINPQLAADPNQLVSGHALICGYAGTAGSPLAWGASGTPAAGWRYTIARKGEYLSEIAAKDHLSLQDLLRLNPQYLFDPNALDDGDVVRIG